MSGAEGSKAPQGGGELSGLLRHAEILQRDLDKALLDLKQEVVESQDAQRIVTLKLCGDGTLKELQLKLASLADRDRKALEEALHVALRLALERLFELRRKRATAVTKGLTLPGLFT